MKAGITALIPTWNRRDLLAGIVRQLQTEQPEVVRIIVIDNGSTDQSAEWAGQAGVEVIRFAENRGFAAAVNAGWRAVQTRWTAVLNNDVLLVPGYLSLLREHAEQWRAAWATGKLLTSSGNLIDATTDAVSRGACAWRAGHGRPDGPFWSETHTAQFVPLTAALLRTCLRDEVGLLDERFESYLEDIDFSLRCAIQGREGLYVPEAIGRHLGSATLGRWNRDTALRTARNQVWLVAKHYPAGWFRREGWPVLVGQLLWLAVAFRHGTGLAALRGKWEGVRRFREMRQGGACVPPGTPVAALLNASEEEIRKAQNTTGWDLYWRLYFGLT